YTPQGLGWALDRALALYRNKKLLNKARRNAMAKDHSWTRQTQRYVELYGKLVAETQHAG
ncbi:MAG: glycogen synthase, partial [Gammaproteobacteria bacterium]|nr:glycogen synthase [Gammaproteobacteria bacterium]